MGLTERGLGILIESFADFLQRLFEGNGNMEPSEEELEKALIAQGNLTLKETLELPFSKWLIKLKNINTKDLDKLNVHLYGKIINDKTNSVERLERTILQLINYLDDERDEFSLERNNIKNTLLHNK
ncbi:hypothetical protein J0X14_15215 [Muricauda sp. CAU 1633]|uniref:hypothetical protein n=1 Tax=Allomuricauda sp. CAU 1633 TaxID=2816036 RepID=UPI001A8F2E10|nr:hypothetical protein [Muricauda sp. CAU 1633]MBO0323658.1 hypothetical protein [Muricauda sp. CAU 1633]